MPPKSKFKSSSLSNGKRAQIKQGEGYISLKRDSVLSVFTLEEPVLDRALVSVENEVDRGVDVLADGEGALEGQYLSKFRSRAKGRGKGEQSSSQENIEAVKREKREERKSVDEMQEQEKGREENISIQSNSRSTSPAAKSDFDEIADTLSNLEADDAANFITLQYNLNDVQNAIGISKLQTRVASTERVLQAAYIGAQGVFTKEQKGVKRKKEKIEGDHSGLGHFTNSGVELGIVTCSTSSDDASPTGIVHRTPFVSPLMQLRDTYLVPDFVKSLSLGDTIEFRSTEEISDDPSSSDNEDKESGDQDTFSSSSTSHSSTQNGKKSSKKKQQFKGEKETKDTKDTKKDDLNSATDAAATTTVDEKSVKKIRLNIWSLAVVKELKYDDDEVLRQIKVQRVQSYPGDTEWLSVEDSRLREVSQASSTAGSSTGNIL